MESLELFEKIAVPHKPFNTSGKYDIDSSKKINAIVNILENLKKEKSIELEYIIHKKFGIVVANSFDRKKNKKRKALIKDKLKNIKLLVVSHIDLINKFNKKFENNYKLVIDNEKVSGALDNTITNAILLNIVSKIDMKDTMILFSLGEEYYCESCECDILKETCADEDCRGFDEKCGAEKFAKEYTCKTSNIKILNLDVTANEYHEFYNKKKNTFDSDNSAAFIEYDSDKEYGKYSKKDKTRYSELKEFSDFKNKFGEKVSFCDYSDEFNEDENGTGDDLDSFTDKDFWGVSFNLSTEEEIHSLENYTTKTKIANYENMLIEMIAFMKNI